MRRTVVFAIVAIGICYTGAVPSEAAAAKCTSISAQCAVEIGGTCDPATGRWEYGRARSGGTNRFGSFDACIARKLREQRK
jgi:hypothetical protein